MYQIASCELACLFDGLKGALRIAKADFLYSPLYGCKAYVLKYDFNTNTLKSMFLGCIKFEIIFLM